MKVSVIIPSYKPDVWIYKCLDSLVKQTMDKSEYEIIIILNGCNEPYKSDLDYYIKTYMKGVDVKFIQLDQAGVSNARNIGISNSNGEYIAFIDDDDYVSTDYLKGLYDVASPFCVSLSDAVSFNDEDDKINYDYSHHVIYEKFKNKKKNKIFHVRKFFNGPCMKLIHRNIIGERTFDVNFKNGEDNLFMFLISDRIKEVKFANYNTIYYRRIREGSAINIKRKKNSIINNCFKLMISNTKYYVKNITEYNFFFYLSREAAELKSILITLMRK